MDVITFKPSKGDIMYGVVTGVNEKNLEIRTGPFICHIDQRKIGDEFEYEEGYDRYVRRSDQSVIKRNTTVRYRIENLQFT